MTDPGAFIVGIYFGWISFPLLLRFVRWGERGRRDTPPPPP